MRDELTKLTAWQRTRQFVCAIALAYTKEFKSSRAILLWQGCRGVSARAPSAQPLSPVLPGPQDNGPRAHVHA
jgi:hypothetical protein